MQRARSRESDGQPLRGSRMRPTGMTIGMKFAVATVLVSAFIAVVTGIFAASILQDHLYDQLMITGSTSIQTMEVLGHSYLEQDAVLDQNIELLDNITANLQVQDDATKTLINDVSSKLTRLRRTLRVASQRMLPRGGLIESASITVESPVQGQYDLIVGNPSNLALGEGTLTGQDAAIDVKPATRVSDGHPVLRFRKDVELRGLETSLFLVVSREAVDEGLQRLNWAVVLAVLGAIVIGSIIAILGAARITRPVRTLVDDIQTVARGDLDHRTRASSHDEIGVLARAFDQMTQGLREARDVEIERRAQEREMAIAGEIQENLLPKRIPKIEGFDVAAHYQATKEVGGDYYDFVELEGDRLGLIVADVSGKGVPGAMVMSMVRALLRMEALNNDSTASTLSKTNRIVNQDIKRGMFVTAMFAVLDLKQRQLLVSSAGHNPMMIYRGDKGRVEQVNPNGIALGFDPGPIFERTVEEQVIPLNTGDRVVLYTDGVIEAMNAKREEFTEARFVRLIREAGSAPSREFVDRLVKALAQHQGAGRQHDDITILTFRVL
jgi:serine phosphatase RsbU (regulator of sigma subunit)